MKRFLTLLFFTTAIFLLIYNAHYVLSFTYHRYCNGVAMASPPCTYLLDMMYLAVSGVKHVWVYLGALVTGIFLYAFNCIFTEINHINAVLRGKSVLGS